MTKQQYDYINNILDLLQIELNIIASAYGYPNFEEFYKQRGDL